jgi:hypothetical protein
MNYIGNAFSPSMLADNFATVTFKRTSFEEAKRYIAEAPINALNPRHPTTIKALGLEMPPTAITVTLQWGDQLLIATPKIVDRTGVERELSIEDLSFTLVTVL